MGYFHTLLKTGSTSDTVWRWLRITVASFAISSEDGPVIRAVKLPSVEMVTSLDNAD